MAYVNTDPTAQTAKLYTNIDEIARVLRAAIADECSATNTYSLIISSLELMKQNNTSEVEGPNYDAMISQIKEIMNDENQHMGKLIAIISTITPDAGQEMIKGVQGE